MAVAGNAKVPSDLERWDLSRFHLSVSEGTSRVQSTGTRPQVVVTGGARGVVGHAGTRLLTDLADKTGLTSGFVEALGLDRVRRSAHEPGRVAIDLAVLLADGGEAIADLAVLRQQPALFGPVASDPTAWRVLDAIDTAGLRPVTVDQGLQLAR